MPSPMVELKVAHLFKAIIEGEKQLEVYRQVLVEQPDFDPYLAFNFLDKASNGYLSSYSITEFLKEHNIELLEADLVKMFGKESSKIEQQLTFADFLKIILPRASPSLRQLSLTNTTTVKTPKKKDTTISYEIKWALARVIDKQVNFLKKIDSCREVVAKFGDFTLPNVFRSIDVEDIGVIDIDSIYIFLKKNKVFVSENDVMILLRSIDFAEDGKLSYEEFIQIVQPNNSNSTHLQQPQQRSAKKTTPSRSRSPKKSPAPSSKPSKAKSKSPNRTVILAPQRKNSAASYKENKERMSMSMQRPRNRSSEKNSRANSTVNYGTMSTWKDRSFNEYSTIINVPNTMNTSMGSIGNSTGKTWGKRAASPMRTKSNATSELKNLQDKIYRKDSVQKKPEKVVETVLLEENNMNKEEERELASVLREQITLDREIEVMKQELSLQADFNVADIFRLFDVESRGLINKYQLLDGFDLFHVSANKKELYLLMKRFDRDRDGLLRYADFYDLLTPRQENKDAAYSGQRRLPRVLSMKTTFLLRKMLQTALSNEGCSECLRQRLHSRPGFSAYKAFKVLDRNMNGYITIEDFRELLDNYGLYASQKELAGLMGRFDKNHDDRVSYNDFVEEIRPRVQERHRK